MYQFKNAIAIQPAPKRVRIKTQIWVKLSVLHYFATQITDVNLVQAHCLPRRTPTHDFFTRTHQK